MTRTLGLNIAADALSRVRLLLLLDRGSLRLSGGLARTTTEEHAGEAVADGRADRDGTGGRSHLSEHAGLRGRSLGVSLRRDRRCVMRGRS